MSLRNNRAQRYAFLHGGRTLSEERFRCRHCGMEVICDPLLAGVHNRNHCPYCLWSRHMDGRIAGDRRAGCRAPMEPIGLTAKRSRNKYSSEQRGELMLVHRCSLCGKLAINRIAADDSTAVIGELFAASCAAAASITDTLAAQGIILLTEADIQLIQQRLIGA
ncbi:MAG TPA: RNHCP domain-containing protein [Roseiflexaceae bacterium]|nr:RNHCP domain-containing protein [Roseiflexaceae bacterium]